MEDIIMNGMRVLPPFPLAVPQLRLIGETEMLPHRAPLRPQRLVVVATTKAYSTKYYKVLALPRVMLPNRPTSYCLHLHYLYTE